MPRGPLGGRRPASSPKLKLVIRELPEPPELGPSFPEPLIRSGAEEKDIIEDIAQRTTFDKDEIDVDFRSKFMRGFGQTNTYTILIEVKGMSPQSMTFNVDKLVDAGYKFDETEVV